jgi:hypothetical protein
MLSFNKILTECKEKVKKANCSEETLFALEQHFHGKKSDLLPIGLTHSNNTGPSFEAKLGNPQCIPHTSKFAFF